MRRRAALLVALLSVSAFAQESARILPGDEVTILVSGVPEYSGTYIVSTDGTISGKGFDRLSVRGRSLAEVKSLVTRRVARFVRDPKVDVTLKSQVPQFVFMTGTRTPSAAYPFSSGLDLRQVVATSTIPEFPDRFLVNLFRNGKLVRSVGLDELMRTDASKASTKLQPGDTIAILAIPTVRVWVTGLVAKPGEFVLPDGADLYQAIAAAGGTAQEFASDQELKILVRRGPETKEFPVIPNPGTPGFRLQAGDTLALVAPQQVRVTLAGEIKEPGPIVIRETESVIGAVAKAGGVTIDGTLQRMILIRGDEQFILNETVEADGTREVRFKLQNGDLLVVRRNTRTALVLGEVKDAKPVVLKDGKVYRLADVVAEAGGTGPKGTTVRVYVGRPDPKTNKMVATLYRLDRYLKSGDLTQNPVIEPGDVILVGEAQKNTLESISQVLSLAFYFDALVRR